MLWSVVLEKDSWESPGLQGDQTSQSLRKSTLNIRWKDLRWSWSSNTLATWCEELTHWKSPQCWANLKAGEERDDRGWDGWMASPTQCTWVWVNSGSWWGRPGMLFLLGLQRIGHDWVTELNWTGKEHIWINSNEVDESGAYYTEWRILSEMSDVRKKNTDTVR